ncbi:hypothetical protein BV898_18451, partial [Hypsibius exemplaris]
VARSVNVDAARSNVSRGPPRLFAVDTHHQGPGWGGRRSRGKPDAKCMDAKHFPFLAGHQNAQGRRPLARLRKLIRDKAHGGAEWAGG